jgi:hypothetical protein
MLPDFLKFHIARNKKINPKNKKIIYGARGKYSTYKDVLLKNNSTSLKKIKKRVANVKLKIVVSL